MNSANIIDTTNVENMNSTMKSVRLVANALRLYHRHKVHGIDLIPRSGPGILVNNHSLATYDSFLLGVKIFEETGRLIRGLGDRLIFKTPGIKEFFSNMGVVEGNHENAESLLRSGEMIGLAPGGMYESLRSSEERYTIKWQKRKGFIKLAIRQQAPIFLAGCPVADDIFKVYPSWITDFAYKILKIPLPLFRGLGPTLIPRPVALEHYISGPFHPPEYNKETFHQDVGRFHRQICKEMEKLLGRH